MSTENNQKTTFIENHPIPARVILTLAAACLFIGTGYELFLHYRFMLGAPFSQWKSSFFLVALLYLAAFSGTMLLVWLNGLRDWIIRLRNLLRFLRWPLALLCAVAVSFFYIFFKQSEIFSGSYSRLMVYALATLTMSILGSNGERFINRQALLTSFLLLTGIFEVIYNFQHVVDYPFPLYWSEGNRMWDYSVRFGSDLYIYPQGEPINAYIDIGRQSLWGMIFLLPNVSIVGMRFWNAVVFVVPSIFLGMYLFKCEKDQPAKWLLLALWSFLFLNQGPIYSPLVLAAVLVATARDMRLLPAMLLLALASYYARSSRITWTFAPAILAAIIAIADSQPLRTKSGRSIFIEIFITWKRAILLAAAGILGGFFLQDVLPMVISWFNKAQTEATPLSLEGIQEAGGRQPLLWERLLPNPTNPEGILPSLLVATGPIICLLLIYFLKKRSKDIWQSLLTGGALLAFLIVGLVASVKIGGGSNLHNMDMFLIGLLFTAGLAWEKGISTWIPEKIKRYHWIYLLMLLAVILPATRDIMQAVPLQLPPKEVSRKALSEIQEYVEEANEAGEVLFIDHRQLLTFGYIKDVPLIAEYEKKWMMDEAMANNAAYFEDFYRDLSQQRFSLIVNEPSRLKYQGEDYNFGNENDVWVYWVSIPLLCQYEPLKTYEEVGAQLLVPREEPLNDEHVKCPQLNNEQID